MKLPSSTSAVLMAFTALAGCGATGVPSNTPQASPLPQGSYATSDRGIRVYSGTNEPVRVAFDACRELNSTIRTVNSAPRTNNSRVRIPRNGSIGDALQDAAGDFIAATIENAGNAANAQINRGISQGRINQLDAQCAQQQARTAWERGQRRQRLPF